MRWRAFYFLQLGEFNNNNSNVEEEDVENIENSRFKMLFKSDVKPSHTG